jgi:hypothetical protein
VRSSSEKVNALAQSLQINTTSRSGTLQPIQACGIGVSLSSFADQLLGCTGMPGMRHIWTRRGSQIHVHLAILAHQLASAAKYPHQQRTLAPAGSFFQDVLTHLQLFRGELDTDQITMSEERIAIRLGVNVMARHPALVSCRAVPACLADPS